MAKFKDHFSQFAAEYARYRPAYPPELFRYLASLCPERQTAWDGATGNGQAAVLLAVFFDKVIATDASETQIANAAPHPKIEYRVNTAENAAIPPASIDLITVAQALHWFDTNRFFAEVKRVLKPAGIMAVWCYQLLEISPQINEIVKRYYYETVYAYWPPERKILEDGYQSVNFPFTEIQPPQFWMVCEWNLNALLGYLYTWSATQRFIKQNGFNPLPALKENLQEAWGNPAEKKVIKWPLHLRVGK